MCLCERATKWKTHTVPLIRQSGFFASLCACKTHFFLHCFPRLLFFFASVHYSVFNGWFEVLRFCFVICCVARFRGNKWNVTLNPRSKQKFLLKFYQYLCVYQHSSSFCVFHSAIAINLTHTHTFLDGIEHQRDSARLRSNKAHLCIQIKHTESNPSALHCTIKYGSNVKWCMSKSHTQTHKHKLTLLAVFNNLNKYAIV